MEPVRYIYRIVVSGGYFSRRDEK